MCIYIREGKKEQTARVWQPRPLQRRSAGKPPAETVVSRESARAGKPQSPVHPATLPAAVAARQVSGSAAETVVSCCRPLPQGSRGLDLREPCAAVAAGRTGLNSTPSCLYTCYYIMTDPIKSLPDLLPKTGRAFCWWAPPRS